MRAGAPLLKVAAAAVIERGRLLVVSKKAAPGIFYLPGGKPEPGEGARRALVRELREELGVAPVGLRLLGSVDELAAIERVPMRMTTPTRIRPPSWPPWAGLPAKTSTRRCWPPPSAGT